MTVNNNYTSSKINNRQERNICRRLLVSLILNALRETSAVWDIQSIDIPDKSFGCGTTENAAYNIRNGTMIEYNNQDKRYPVLTGIITECTPQTETDHTSAHQTTTTHFNLMLPPIGYSSLCGDLPSYDGGPDQSPTGLLLDTTSTNSNNCSLEEKLTNAYTLNQRLPPKGVIKYLIIPYHIDDAANDTIINESSGIATVNNNFTDVDITVIYLPVEYHQEIQKTIQLKSEMTNNGMFQVFLFGQGNTAWDLRYELMSSNNCDDGGHPPYPYGSKNPNLHTMSASYFAIFNLVIVALIGGCLIHSYCINRRHVQEHQRQIAARHARMQEVIHRHRSLLTQEEFEALPEMKYQSDLYKKLTSSSIDLNTTTNVTSHDIKSDASAVSTSVTVNNGSSQEQQQCDRMNSPSIERTPESSTMEGSDHQDINSDLEAQLTDVNLDNDVVEAPIDIVTSNGREKGIIEDDIFKDACGTCPVCIEDFRIDEMIIILPRCKHAYHKECVRQWLMEKHGCCPLCKTDVLDDAQIRKRLNRLHQVSQDQQPRQERQILRNPVSFSYYYNHPLTIRTSSFES